MGPGSISALGDETATSPRDEVFRQLAEHIQQVFFVLSVRPSRTIYLSPAYEDIFGRPRPSDDRLADPLSSAIHPDDRASTSEGFSRATQGIPTEGEFRILRPDGEVRWLHTRLSPVYDADGIFYRIVGLCEDITAWKHKEQELREARDRLHEAMRTLEREGDEARALSDLVDVLQSCQNVDEAYEVAGKTLPTLVPGGSGALYITRPSRDMLEAVSHWGDDPSVARPFAPDACWALRRGKVQRVEGASSPVQCDHVDASGPLGYVCVPLVAQGEAMGVLHVRRQSSPAGPSAATDTLDVESVGRHAAVIGERVSLVFANLALRDVLRRQSIRDPLTRLFNRRYMEDSLSRECGRASRHDQPLAVAMLDIDRFKHVNDQFGHQAGDVLLRAIGDLLHQQTRAENIACRYGGEEFAVILSNASVDNASTWAGRFREDLRATTVRYLGQVLGPVTVSVGIAGFPEHGTTGEALIKTADAALYQAKREGRDRVVVAQEP